MSHRQKPGPQRGRLLTVAFVLTLFMLPSVSAWAFHQPRDDLVDEPGLVGGCLRGTTLLSPVSARLAFLIPTFTLTPYNNWDSSFYAFYLKHKGAVGPIYDGLGLLKTRVVTNLTGDRLLSEGSFTKFLGSPVAAKCGIVLGQNLHLTDDVAVDGGALFAGGQRNYDVLIIGHEEYVTRGEYDQLKGFVATGGRLIDMSGNSFWGQVNYSRASGVETFLAGHGFQFNGRYAWATSYEPFDAESAGWFGSTFANSVWVLHGAILQGSGVYGEALKRVLHTNHAFTDYDYPHDEVNYLRNFTGTEVIARFFVSFYTLGGVEHFDMPPVPVDAYSHWYRKGQVFCLCVFGENIILRDLGAQFFLVYAVRGVFDGTW